MKSPTPLQERARGKERRVRLILSPVVFLSQFRKTSNKKTHKNFQAITKGLQGLKGGVAFMQGVLRKIVLDLT